MATTENKPTEEAPTEQMANLILDEETGEKVSKSERLWS